MVRLLCTLAICVAGLVASAADGDGPVTALAIAPNGDIVTAGQTGISGAGYQTEVPNVHDLAFSPDGNWLLVAGGTPAESGAVEFHSRKDPGAASQRFELTDDVIYSAAWSPDGSRAALASLDGSCVLVRPGDGKVERVIRGHSRGVAAVRFLSDDVLVTASLDHTIRVWQIEDGELKRTLRNHTAPVTGVAVRPGRESSLPMLASISHDRTVRLWQPTIGRMVRFVRLDSRPLSVAWTRDGTRLVVACRDGDVRIIDPDTVEVQAQLDGIESHAWCLAVTRDGKEIVVAGGGGDVSRLATPPVVR